MNLKVIEIAIHYRATCRDYKPVCDLTESEMDTITEMKTLGLLTDTRDSVDYVPYLGKPVFRGTEKLYAYVRALESVKIPELRWVQPDV